MLSNSVVMEQICTTNLLRGDLTHVNKGPRNTLKAVIDFPKVLASKSGRRACTEQKAATRGGDYWE